MNSIIGAILVVWMLTACQGSPQREPIIDQQFNVAGIDLYLQCFDGRAEPNGYPTVLLEHGIGKNATSDIWTRVQDQVAPFARVCRYDRADVGRSGPSGQVSRGGLQLVSELHQLLKVADVQGPYLHVGHSFGGYVVRLNAAHPESDLMGIVLVDAPHEDMPDEIPLEPEKLDAQAIAAELQASPSLGNMPLIVVTRGEDVTERWREYQQRLLELSSNSTQLIAANSDHQIPWNQPKTVVEAIELLLKPYASEL